MRGGNGCQRIACVVAPRGLHRENTLFDARKAHHAVFVNTPTLGIVEALKAAEAPAVKHAAQGLALCVRNDQALGRNRAHQVMKLRFDRGQVFEDVGVIVFKVVQDRRPGTVVHELASLVEKGRVVLVGFDNEAIGVPEHRRNLLLLRHAAHEVARVHAAGLQNMHDHRGRRGLAVRARHA